ncbi:MAG: T9SS type A sorting domain-containing protein [Ignavibacteriae bacterium]|nr:T9SS type A sorting domain-containing protein [Ignavibacteriota bacterium]
MRLRYIILFLIAASCLTFAQKKRYLVSPYQEVIPLDKDQSARMVMDARQREAERARNAECSNSVLDGFTPTAFPGNNNFGARHKDVMGEWFQVRFNGRIDTIFWATFTGSEVGALDSTLYVRIHRSNIGPNAGPGVRPGPYNPPCQNWGYWRNTADLDQGVAAFPEDATDTAWVSTIAGTTPSFPPFAEELWGLGGFPVIHHPGVTNYLAMSDLPTPVDVEKGDLFFLSMRVNGPPQHVDDGRTEFLAADFDSRLPEYREYYPSRNWKFYEHDSGPSPVCAGIPTNQVKRGWVARGNASSDDTLLVYGYNFWYSISTLDNTPPQLLSSNTLRTTLSTEPRTVIAELQDCDPSNPDEAGIASAVISYSVNGVFVETVTMDNLGGNTFVGEIPGQEAWKTVSYSIIATDTKGLMSNFPQGSYRVVGLKNEYFTTVVSSGCSTNDIKNTGTEIPPSALFKHPNNDEDTNVKDDGSAGPFALGTPFNLFGQQLNYAWVSVNGAIALSTAATETLDVSSTGFYSSFDFPGSVRKHSDPRDTAVLGRKPYNFISGYWADLIYGDTTAGSQYGRILYEDLGTKFVVQWDSLAIFDQNGDHYPDEMIFRIVLDKSSGNISFEYDNVGTGGSDTLCRIGVQVDTIAALGDKSPWIYVNVNNTPTETTPINGRCITLLQGSGFSVANGWNMVSVPVVPSSFVKSTLFPTATSDAFRFEGGYLATDPLVNGDGYWLKFNGAQSVAIPGVILESQTISLSQDWNLVGSVSGAVTAPGMDACILSQFYGFSSGYVPVTFLEPGRAYWVKSAGSCDLVLNSGSAALPKSNAGIGQLNGFSKITVRDNSGGQQAMYLADGNSLKVPVEVFELPPVPPVGAFDARFASNRTVETYSSEAGKVGEYVINIQSTSYPVVLQWNVAAKGKSVVISENGEGKNLGTTILNGNGTVRITNPAVSSIKVKVVDDLGLPKEFALGQNYPNPFNPVTRFNVAIPQTGDVDISVFDILGRKVSTIISGELQAGYKTIEWDGRDFGGNASPTGMYFVRMTAGDFSEVQKIMLLK